MIKLIFLTRVIEPIKQKIYCRMLCFLMKLEISGFQSFAETITCNKWITYNNRWHKFILDLMIIITFLLNFALFSNFQRQIENSIWYINNHKLILTVMIIISFLLFYSLSQSYFAIFFIYIRHFPIFYNILLLS